MVQKQQKLQQVIDDIVADTGCAELAKSATQLVVGSGNLDADIVLVGEAPGKKEDETGQPFVGASGRFLDEMLAAAGLRRADVYITNIVKYRPPDNRDPTPAEKQAFWPYLLRQIEIIHPKVVITLGRHSGACFVPSLKISEEHGHARTVQYDSHEFLVIPLYHPAAALYNGGMRQTLTDDFVAAAKLVQTTE